MAKKQWMGAETFPTIWVWICVFFNTIGILAIIMLIIAEIVIIANNFDNYVDQYGHSYPARHYVGEEGCGFVGWTNAPKHVGSAVWMILFQLSIVVFATLVIASDLAWRKATYNEYGGQYVSMFYARGIMAGDHNKGLFYFVVANGFLKLFLVVLYMSQSFHGLKGGSHAPPEFVRLHDGYAPMAVGTRTVTVLPAVTTVAVNAGSGNIVTGPQGGTVQLRDLYSAADKLVDLTRRAGPDPNDPGAAWGTELWAQWAGWIVLGSIVPSIIAFMFLVPWAAKKNEDNKPADEEKGKDAK